jgi:hypothetical protein
MDLTVLSLNTVLAVLLAVVSVVTVGFLVFLWRSA